LYGIETETQCRERIDKLLEITHRAQKAIRKETVSVLIAALSEYRKLGNTIKGQEKLSDVERAYFWHAIDEAHAFRPNLAHPAEWREKLEEVEWKLKKNRPGDGD
jgi:hypothetical protein